MVSTGLIIAAGAGSRLADEREIPKPLRKVCGMPLLERTIRCAAKAGLKKIFIVVGFDKEKIISFLNSKTWPLQVETIENPDWQKSNGLSVLAAKNHIQEDFVLLMSDHVFVPQLLQGLVQSGLGNCSGKLAVDYKVKDIFDMDDATKVEVQEGLIKAIDKKLVQFNAIDTGCFLLSPGIFKELEAVYHEKGDCSLSQGILALAQQKKMGVHDIGSSFWQDVDTQESLGYAEKMLFQSCRKPTDGVISRNFNRYISLFISSRLVKTPLTANQVTFITTIIGLFSGYFAALGSYGSYLIGAFLFKLTSILDGVDGEMSKLRVTDSKFGQWLDTISDNLTYVVFIIGTVIGVHQRPDLGAHEWLPAAALFGLGMLLGVMFTILLTSTDSGSLLAIQQDFVSSEKKSFFKKLWGKIYFVIKRDFFATVFLFLAIFNKPHWILFLIALATNIAWVVILQNRLQKKLKS